MAKNNKKLVPGSKKALDTLKYEIAAEMGLPVGKSYFAQTDTEFASELGAIPQFPVKEDYWGYINSRNAGAVGGTIVSRMIRQAEETLFTL